MDRRSQQEHIRAAQVWLGSAEDSISRKNDVQGDLKLMLARAELSRVGRFSRSKEIFRWGMKFAALLVAAGLAAAFWQPERAPSVPVEPVAADSSIAVPDSQQAAGRERRPVERQPEVMCQVPGEKVQNASSAQSPVENPPMEKAIAEPVEKQTAALPAQASPQLPDEAKQKLMQAAGKILRQ